MAKRKPPRSRRKTSAPRPPRKHGPQSRARRAKKRNNAGAGGSPVQAPGKIRPSVTEPWRLNRIISSAGLSSRRNADAWIRAGRISVNGKRIETPGKTAVWGKDTICVDGRPIPGPVPLAYWMLNKPFGYICSLKDPEGRPVVTDLVPKKPGRCYPVGRLDFDTLGLLLLTNDGDFAHHLTHPRYHVPKTYKATVAGHVDENALERIRRGVMLEDGPTRGAQAERIRQGDRKSILRLTITEGRSRQVRRMLDAAGLQVIHLIRTGIGNLRLGDLKVGLHRHLTPAEVLDLKKIAGLA